MASYETSSSMNNNPTLDERIRYIAGLSRHQVSELDDEGKLEYLFWLQVKHAKMKTAATELMDILSPYSGIDIVALVGATGVGKTTLMRHMLRQVYQARTANEHGTIPFIYISVPSNGNRSLSWSEIYTEALDRACEPLIAKKTESREEDGFLHQTKHKTLAGLRKSLENALKYRKVRLVVIDEAVHLLRFGNYTSVMDTLKSLCDRGSAKIALVGSYDLLDLFSYYGQVARRGEIVHFQRYVVKRQADLDEVGRILGRIQAHWPCHAVPNFVSAREGITDISLGCMGLIKLIASGCLGKQLKNKGKWDNRFLHQSAKAPGLLTTMRTEIETGEAKVIDATYGALQEMQERLKVGLLNGTSDGPPAP